MPFSRCSDSISRHSDSHFQVLFSPFPGTRTPYYCCSPLIITPYPPLPSLPAYLKRPNPFPSFEQYISFSKPPLPGARGTPTTFPNPVSSCSNPLIRVLQFPYTILPTIFPGTATLLASKSTPSPICPQKKN